MHRRARPSIAATLQIRGIARFRSNWRFLPSRKRAIDRVAACDHVDKALRAEKRLKPHHFACAEAFMRAAALAIAAYP